MDRLALDRPEETMTINESRCRELFPEADPHDPATVAKMREWLKESEETLAEFLSWKKYRPVDVWFHRSTGKQEREAIKRYKAWLKAAGQS